MNKNNAIPIFNSFLAKQLLLRGHRIVDLQKNKTVKNATIFYFEDTEKLRKDMEDINSTK